MHRTLEKWLLSILTGLCPKIAGFLVCGLMFAGSLGAAVPSSANFPRELSAYPDSAGRSLVSVLQERVRLEPFNVIATALFLMAILHTFSAPVFVRLAHRYHNEAEKLGKHAVEDGTPLKRQHSHARFRAEIFHFLGEVEAIFGIWILPLMIAITVAKGWPAARDYVGHRVNFTEPLFVVVIMSIAASRPVLALVERWMAAGAALGGSSPASWWVSILIVGPILGSFITEPAAMTISALLLADKFYRYNPSPKLAYGTLGLLFVNVSVGGTFTHFAAPPVLMVAGKWGWGFAHMLEHFGWKAAVGIVAGTLLYYLYFRKEFSELGSVAAKLKNEGASPGGSIPFWITLVHLLFLAWTVFTNHYPALFLGGFLFYLAFTRATEDFQSDLALRPALLVGFFLAGLVVHGGLQGWWIGPVLRNLSELPLFLGAVCLTAFNDNAAITYLASLVPDFSPALQHAVVAGAVVGGGLTVIANAPNPAGQSILSKFFPDGISPLKLFLGAFVPTLLVGVVFALFR